jgi:hypothetical protein
MSRKKASARNKRRVVPRPGKHRDAARSMSKETLLAPGMAPFQPLHVAFDVLITRAADLLMKGGLKAEEVERALRTKADAYAKGRLRKVHQEDSHFGLLKQLAGVMHDWWREPDFLGPDGNPKTLPVQGPGVTLSSLVARRIPTAMVPAAIDWMEKAGMFTRPEEGLAKASKRQVIMPPGSPGPLMSERGLTLAANALGTAAHNYNLDAKLPVFADRNSFVSRLSLKHFRQFRELVQLHGGIFLETIDNWLEDHQVKKPGEPGIEAGVHFYMYAGRRAKAKRSGGKRGATS